MSEKLPKPRRSPCGTCPYRRDVPSGIWDASEYAKLPAYDGETGEQILKGAIGLFFCHHLTGDLCAGWIGCHNTRHLLALRLHPVDPSTFDYVSPSPLFASGAQAAAHGLEQLEEPGDRARIAIRKLGARRRRKARRGGGPNGI